MHGYFFYFTLSSCGLLNFWIKYIQIFVMKKYTTLNDLYMLQAMAVCTDVNVYSLMAYHFLWSFVYSIYIYIAHLWAHWLAGLVASSHWTINNIHRKEKHWMVNIRFGGIFINFFHLGIFWIINLLKSNWWWWYGFNEPNNNFERCR